MNRDVLKGLCERLFWHHMKSEAVCRGLEEVGKSSGPHHVRRHIYNRDFYERMGKTGERALHFPKIVKDALLLKRNERVLEGRRHALRVYRTLKEAGAKFDWGIEGV